MGAPGLLAGRCCRRLIDGGMRAARRQSAPLSPFRSRDPRSLGRGSDRPRESPFPRLGGLRAHRLDVPRERQSGTRLQVFAARNAPFRIAGRNQPSRSPVSVDAASPKQKRGPLGFDPDDDRDPPLELAPLVARLFDAGFGLRWRGSGAQASHARAGRYPPARGGSGGSSPGRRLASARRAFICSIQDHRAIASPPRVPRANRRARKR